jgi:hypothetical protein
MTNTPPQRERTPVTPQGQRRQVAVPGAQQNQRRVGLLAVGLVLVFGAGFGFWFVLRSVDQRSEYLIAARTIQRWEVAQASDFAVVEAHVGEASALAAERSGAVLGKWATGRIPAGTIITEGLFETPPLSAEDEADKVLAQVRLPSGEAPLGALDTGDTVALLGREGTGPDGEAGPLGLIGVLQLEFVQGDDIYYVVTPGEALAIKQTVDRYTASADRTMLKLGFGVTTEDLLEALGDPATNGRAAIADVSTGAGTGAEPVEGQ